MTTFEACETLRKAADAQDDEEMMHILNGIGGDLIAAEEKYHKDCHSSYISKQNLKYRIFKEENEEDSYASAFRLFAGNLQKEINDGRAFDMETLLQLYMRQLEHQGIEKAKASDYTVQRLKLRMVNYFGKDIVFHKPPVMNKPELVYGSFISLQDVINAAVKQVRPSVVTELPHAEANVESKRQEERKLIYSTALLIKGEIANCVGISSRPLNVMDVSLSKAKAILPHNLYWLLRWIVSSESINLEDIAKESCR